MTLDESGGSDQGLVRFDEHSEVQSAVEAEQDGEKVSWGGIKSEIAKIETRAWANVSVSVLEVT